jgi:hypothetical protein
VVSDSQYNVVDGGGDGGWRFQLHVVAAVDNALRTVATKLGKKFLASQALGLESASRNAEAVVVAAAGASKNDERTIFEFADQTESDLNYLEMISSQY